jgi:hypothetical protein
MKLKKAHSVSISPTDPFLEDFDRIDFHDAFSLKTIVKTHHLTGKIYFGIVQHVHPKVVCSLLNSLSA